MKTLKNSINKNIFVIGAIMLLSGILILFYIFPTIYLFYKGVVGSKFTLYNYLGPLFNSIKISIWVFLWTSLIGCILAWLVVKTDFPLKKVIDDFCIVAFAIPPYIIALSWLQIFGRNGYFERFIKVVLHFDNYTATPYSLNAAIFVLTLHLFPLMYFSVKNALKSIEPRLEYAAQVSGAKNALVFRRITFPLIKPSIITTGLFIFSRSLANFSVPALLCLPARVEVATTKIYSSLTMLDSSKAAFYSLVLVVFSTFLYFLQAFLINKNQKISLKSTISSRDISTVRLNKYKLISVIIVLLFFILVSVIPAITMIISSLLKRWGLSLTINHFTLDNYKEIFSLHSKSLLAFRNSFLFGLIAAVFATIISLSCLIISHYLGKKFRIFEAVASWPMAIPNTVLAVATIYCFNSYPLKLYGTIWGLIFTYMVLFTPIIMNQIKGLLSSQDIKLLQAARLSGYNSFLSFFKVVFPFLLPGVKSGIIVALMISLREIPISLMLYSTNQETVGVLLFGMQSQSFGLEMTSALSVVVVLIIILGNYVNRKNKEGKHGKFRN
ncbi:MAG: ABC transporter permease [Pleomorphochaeta sp.]